MSKEIKYPYLPQGRAYLYVPSDNPNMLAAKEAAHELSTDRSHPTGAVVVKDGKVIARAANTTALSHPTLINLHKKGLCVRKLFKIPTGQKYWLCPGCGDYDCHAETSAVRAAKTDTTGADVYLWGHWWACAPCWNSMIQGGIRNLYLEVGSDVSYNRDDPKNVVGQV